jgi:hypothetical protein
VEEADRRRVAAVLASGPDLEPGRRGAAALDGDLHELGAWGHDDREPVRVR